MNAVISAQKTLCLLTASRIYAAVRIAIVGSGGQMVNAHTIANRAAVTAPAMWTVFVIDCLYADAAPTNAMPAQLRNAANWKVSVVAESIGGSMVKATVHIAKVNVHGCLLT